jgi:hypothetical protein
MIMNFKLCQDLLDLGMEYGYYAYLEVGAEYNNAEQLCYEFADQNGGEADDEFYEILCDYFE